MAYPSPVESEVVYSSLPLWIALIPLAGGFLVYRIALRDSRWRGCGAVLAAGLTLLLAGFLFYRSGGGAVELKLQAGFLERLLYFRVDRLGAAFTLLAALIWFLATLFSVFYMRHEGEQNRYYLFFLLSLGGCLGVFMTGDLLSLFVFFEIMSFTSCVLVVHARTAEADEAGRNYLYLGVLGGLLLLAAILLLYCYTGSVTLAPRLEELERLGNLRFLIAACLIAGFGIKAGMVPLHIWLPKAHPVAPSPASALLSGIMIKTGAYGIIRVINLLFTPAHHPEAGHWETAALLGLVMIWIGTATMFTAAFIALFQNNAKRILAYSSISQMGYILMGAGAAAYLGYHGAAGLAGAVYHIVNHAFFKASLFMLVGAVYIRTHELDVRKLGGLWRSLPATTLAFLVAAAGITGVPGLNGYTGKTLLHHAIVEALAHGHGPGLAWAEKIFTVTGALTVCYITKLCCGIFFGKRPAGLGPLPKETPGEMAVFAALSAAIAALGSFPAQVLNRLIIPAAAVFPLDHHALEHLAGLNFWDHHDLQAIAAVLGLGLLLYLLFGRLLQRVSLPAWLSVEQAVYRPLVFAAGFLLTGGGRAVETAVDRSYSCSPYALRVLTISGSLVDAAAENLLIKSTGPLQRACLALSRFDSEGTARLGRWLQRIAVRVRDGFYRLWYDGLRRFIHGSGYFWRRIFFVLVRMDFNPKGIRFFQSLNISNLDFNLLLMMIFLLVLLSLFFLFY
jgi:formate hydrogenlyase subunit 3/multisubunit Na+/H+ antiporter MnhD subunit